jgi:hypothetical protein
VLGWYKFASPWPQLIKPAIVPSAVLPTMQEPDPSNAYHLPIGLNNVVDANS